MMEFDENDVELQGDEVPAWSGELLPLCLTVSPRDLTTAVICHVTSLQAFMRSYPR